MRIWHEGIYGNEDAQEYLEILSQIAEDCETLDEFLAVSHQHPLTDFFTPRLILADLEADFTGEVTFFRDVIALIEHYSTPSMLEGWQNPERRRKVLQGFNDSLHQRVAIYKPLDLYPYDEIFDWLIQKEEAGWLESVA